MLTTFVRKPQRPARRALVIFGGLVTAVTMPAAVSAQTAVNPSAIALGHAVNVIGFSDAKPGSGGALSVNPRAITLAQKQTVAIILLAAIRAYSIEHSTKGLVGGTAGSVAPFAPQGMGQLYSAFRPGAETLSLLYEDDTHALHTAVVTIPKGSKDQALRAMALTGLKPSASLTSVATVPPPVHVARNATTAVATDGRPTIRVMMPQVTAQGLPSAYLAGTYETIIAQLVRSGEFSTVWRQNDERAGGDIPTLATNITAVRKGSAGMRGALPVVGMFAGKTLIVADLRYTDAHGAVILESSVKGSKRTPGENIVAVNSLAQRVAKAVHGSVVASQQAHAVVAMR